jgi:hypothetical protein
MLPLKQKLVPKNFLAFHFKRFWTLGMAKIFWGGWGWVFRVPST